MRPVFGYARFFPMSEKPLQATLAANKQRYRYQRIAEGLRQQIAKGVYKPGSRLPSLDELAAFYGVNRLTVNKAVAELRREGRVYSVPAQGTYISRPSLPVSAQQTRQQRLPVYGLLSHVLHPAGYGLYHQALISGIYDELNGSEANLLVIAASVVDQAKLPALMIKAQANGMIYLGQFSKPVLAEMVKNGPAAVLVDYAMPGVPCDSISVDNLAGAQEAVGYLLGQGYGRDLAVISGVTDDRSTVDRLKGAKRAFSQAGIPFETIRVISGGYSREGGEVAMQKLLDGGRRPRAVFCLNDEMAVGAIDAIRQAGLQVPGDIAVMGFDDSLWAETTQPPLTTMRVDSLQMGRMAVKLLQARIGEPQASPSSTVLQPMLVRRGSA